MKFGLIGAGLIGKKFVDACQLVPEAEIVAVSSATPGKAQAFAAEKGISSYYDSYEDMLKDADIDCVYICTTHNFHYENLLLCIEYNKHVICEKCMVLTQKDAEDIFAKARAKNLFVMEALWTRFVPSMVTAKEWITSGKIGTVKLADYRVGFKAPDDPNHRLINPKLAGGALYDIGVYSIQNTTFLIGQELLEIKSFMETDLSKKVDATTCVMARFTDSIATFMSSFTCEIDDYCTIYGTKGKITVENPFFVDKATLRLDDGTVEVFETERINGFEFEIAHAIKRINAGYLESDIITQKNTSDCAGIFDKCFAENKGLFG